MVETPSEDGCGQLSPDGRWLAYSSGEPGKQEVYVQPFAPGSRPEGRWQISINGGTVPRWGSGEKELFYLDLDQNLMAVPVINTVTFQTGAPKPLFQTRSTGFLSYAVAADGQRFLINTVAVEPARSAPTVILNWNAALQP